MEMTVVSWGILMAGCLVCALLSVWFRFWRISQVFLLLAVASALAILLSINE